MPAQTLVHGVRHSVRGHGVSKPYSAIARFFRRCLEIPSFYGARYIPHLRPRILRSSGLRWPDSETS